MLLELKAKLARLDSFSNNSDRIIGLVVPIRIFIKLFWMVDVSGMLSIRAVLVSMILIKHIILIWESKFESLEILS